MTYKLGSLFDGSGGFPLAGSLCGIEPRWAAEVEPYPIAVTRSRFPGMKHLGDISKINGAEIEPVDIITFGSPCQDLSVAGKRAGLKHEANGDDETTRSGLLMEAVRTIKEMREATHGKYPSFALWENVPGAFSSNNGEDFRVVLEELIKIVEPNAVMPPVPKNGWAYADCYYGDGWSIAYRVFDAQYWGKSIRDRDSGIVRHLGTPQRRRRIHLVLDLRGKRAREVLFKSEGLRGYFETGRTPWQAAAGDAENCIGAADREGAVGSVGFPLGFRPENTRLYDEVATTICNGTRPGFTNGVIRPVAYSFDSLASNSMKSSNPHSGCRQVEVAKTLDTTDPNPCKNQGGIAVVETLPFDTTQITSPMNYSHPKYGDPCHPLAAGARPPAVVVKEATPIHDQATRFSGKRGDKSDGKGNGLGVGEPGDPMNTLTSGDRHAVAYLASGKETVGTLMANAGTKLWLGNQEAFSGDYHIIEETKQPAIRYIVRRLTPTECARLQGFADRWGDVASKSDFSDEEYSFWLEVRNTHAAINGKKVQDYTKDQMLTWYNKLHTDSAEYKMWGNGIALPPALYCMQGMVDAFEREDDDDWML